MKIAANTILKSKFLGNYFCLIPNTRIAFVVIAKNASTFLKKTALYNESGNWPLKSDDAHYGIGFDEKSKYLIPISNMEEYESQHGKFVKFAVWRDPVERIISSYKLFCLENEYRFYFHFLDIGPNTDFDRFMEFLRFEWGKRSIMQDEHFRRQADYFDPKQVDYVVSLKKLHSFLVENGVKFVSEQSNKTNKSFNIRSKAFIDEIIRYYEVDYHIPINY